MKKALRISGIVLLALIAVLLLLTGLAGWILFSRSGLEKTARYAIDNYAPCRITFEEMHPSIIRTFPHIGLTIKDLTVYEELESAPSDTMISLGEVTLGIDADAYRKENIVRIQEVFLSDAFISLYKDADGHSSLDVFASGKNKGKDEEPVSFTLPDSLDTKLTFDLEKFRLSNTNIRYTDDSTDMSAIVNGIGLKMSGRVSPSLDGNADITVEIADAGFSKDGENVLQALLTGIGMNAEIALDSPDADGEISITLSDADVLIGDSKAGLDGFSAGFDGIIRSDAGTLNGKLSLRTDNVSYLSSEMDVSAGSADLTADVDGQYTLKDLVSLCLEGMVENVRMQRGGESPIVMFINRLGLDADVCGLAENLSGNADALFDLHGVDFAMRGESPLTANADHLNLDLKCSSDSGLVYCNPTVYSSSMKLESNGERYLSDWPVRISLPLTADTAFSVFSAKDGFISVNGQELAFDADCRLKADGIDATATVSSQGLDISSVLSMLPAGVSRKLEGINADGRLSFEAYGDISRRDSTFDLHEANARLKLDKFSGSVHDSISGNAENLNAYVEYDALHPDRYTALVSAGNIAVSILSDRQIDALLSSMDMTLVSDVRNMAFDVDAAMNGLELGIDTISVSSGTMAVNGTYRHRTAISDRKRIEMSLQYDTLNTSLGSGTGITTGTALINAAAEVDTAKTDFLTRWNPVVSVNLNNASMKNPSTPPIAVPRLEFDFSLGRFDIARSRILFGNSDISLSGNIRDIDAFIEKRGTMEGSLDFISDYTDMDELMSFLSGLGREEQVSKTESPAFADVNTSVTDSLSADNAANEPFIVPELTDIVLNTHINRMAFNGHEFSNVGGDITIKDGTLILQELGFSSEAAEMQLTAIYRTPRTDHLYAGLDFHLLNINVDELIDLIPSVDSIVPMLKSFEGRAQFHLAAETYMNENYMPKMPTLIGAAAIEGKDLKVMDNEVFSTIKKKLLMSRKAENRIDSLSVEMQVLRNKVDLYPFLVHMDRYTAVIGGRHNINKALDCNYHISVIQTPLPIRRLGVNISGAISEIAKNPIRHIRLGKCLYDNTFNQQKMNATDERILEMKAAITETLKANVR